MYLLIFTILVSEYASKEMFIFFMQHFSSGPFVSSSLLNLNHKHEPGKIKSETFYLSGYRYRVPGTVQINFASYLHCFEANKMEQAL